MDADFNEGGDPTLIAVSGKPIPKDKYTETDIKAAQLLSETLFGSYLNSLTGNEKIFGIKCLLDFVNQTRYMFFPTEKPDEELEKAITDLNASIKEKYTKTLEGDEIEDLSNIYEELLVPNFYLPAIKTAVRDKFLGEKILENPLTEEKQNGEKPSLTIEERRALPANARNAGVQKILLTSDDSKKIAELLIKNELEINPSLFDYEGFRANLKKIADKISELRGKNDPKINKLLDRVGIFNLEDLIKDADMNQVQKKMIVMDELKTKMKNRIQNGGSLKDMAMRFIVAVLGVVSTTAGSTIVAPETNVRLLSLPNYKNETAVVPAPTYTLKTVAAPTPAKLTEQQFSRYALEAKKAQEKAAAANILTIFSNNHAPVKPKFYDTKVLDNVHTALQGLEHVFTTNPAIVNQIESQAIKDVLATFTLNTLPPIIKKCDNDEKIAEVIGELLKGSRTIVNKPGEIKTIMENIAQSKNYEITRVMLVIKNLPLSAYVGSWFRDLVNAETLHSSENAYQISRIILDIDKLGETEDDMPVDLQRIFILGNNLDVLKPLAAAYGPLRGNGFINTEIGNMFFNFLASPGAQSIDFVTLASVAPSRPSANSSSSSAFLSIVGASKRLKLAELQRAYYNYVNNIHAQASTVVNAGESRLLLSSGEPIPSEIVAAASNALIEVQQITDALIGPAGTAFLGEEITIDAVNRSLTELEAGLGNITAGNPLTEAIAQTKAGLNHVSQQVKELALNASNAAHQTGLKFTDAARIVGTTLAVICPLLISILASSMKNTWYKPWRWFTAPAEIGVEVAMVAGGTSGFAMLGYLLGLGNYTNIVPILVYAIYSKQFVRFLLNKLNEPEPMAPVAAQPAAAPALATGALTDATAAPAPAASPRRSRWSAAPIQPSTLTPTQQAAIAIAKLESRRRASSVGPRPAPGGGYRMTSKPHNRKTDKHKKSRKQKSKRLTRRRKAQK